MTSFQAKTGRQRPRKKKKKLSFRSFPTQPVIENSKKNNKKNQKIKKHHYGFFSSQNVLGEAEKEKKKKIIVPINSYPKWNRKFKKIKKTSLWLLFKPKWIGRGREKKNYRSDQFLPDP